MLTLKRKIGGRLIINDDITIVVVKAKGNHVWLGVEAPKQVPVPRQELFERILKERKRKEEEKAKTHKKTTCRKKGKKTS